MKSLSTIQARMVAMVFACMSAASVFALPNLTPYQPSGWSDKIVVSKVTGTTTDSSPLYTTDTLYVDWAVINNGNAAAGSFYVYIYVDGAYKTSWNISSLNANTYTYANDYSIGSLSAGTHTITITADATGAIAESNESDNSYTKTITVSNPSLPNLVPYQPAGWSDKIVVSRTTGTTTDSTSLTTADTLYVDWAVGNIGSAATGSGFYNTLYVDGAVRTAPYYGASLGAGMNAATTDYSIGSLSAGTHTIMITVDSGFQITESNEGDNSYTKTITVGNPSLPNLVPYQPAGWSDKIVVSRTTGTTTDSTSLTTADTLYVDWAVGNIGTAATGSGFYNTLYVDGAVKTAPYYGASLGAGMNAATTDYSIGSLSAGTHTIMITVDSGFQITESNESDNSYTKTITVSNPSLPNLVPYQPAGWSDKIVVSRTTGTTTDSISLTTADTLYVDWAVGNIGSAATGSGFYNTLYVDGAVRTAPYYGASLGAGMNAATTDYSIGSLSAGTHTIMITVDSGFQITESNEGDNSYTKTITVGNPSLPNLVPYQPAGWSDKIVVSRTTGTTTDSTSLTTADTLYVDWAVGNIGTAATGSGFYNTLYVDGAVKTAPYYGASLGAGMNAATTDYSIGSLSAGTHTIMITVDSGFQITESNESDNSYTKTITVTTAGTIAPTITTEPQSQTVQTGANVTFTVAATSTPLLNYQWRFNGQNISGATSSTLPLNAVTAANSGGYSVLVWNAYGLVTSATASLAVLTDGANGNTPVQITVSPPSPKPAGVKNLVFVTHGWQPVELNWAGPPSQPWMVEMTNDIVQQLVASGQSSDWQVEAYYWLWDAWTLSPDTALNNAKNIGAQLGRQFAAQGYQRVHLIGHSAGAGLIQAIADQLKSAPNPPIVQETFLDPFTGRFLQGRSEYGGGADWADDYFVIDVTDIASVLLGDAPGSTSGQLDWAYNVDVGGTLEAALPVQFIVGNGTAGSTPPVYTSPAHGSPIDFYISTINGTAVSCAAGYGFPLSIEAGGSGNWATDSRDNPPVPLCGTASFSQNQQPVRSDSPFVFSMTPYGTSSSGVNFLGSGGASLTSDDPAWLAMGVTITNAVNFVQFDAGFTDTNAAQGLLTVYWNTNQVGMVDERVAPAGLQTYRFVLPGTVTSGLYTLTFRLDSFDNSSNMAVTNVATGFVGVTQPITLGISRTNGAPLVQLRAATNFTYLIQSSTNLVDWTPTALLLSTNGTAQFIDSAVTNSNPRFYRAVMP